jgi:hypothetical protein
MDRPGVKMVLLGLAAAGLVGCFGIGGGGLDVCSTDTVWTDGDYGSALMHPGSDCIGCHAQRTGTKAPKLVIAGTVMNDFKDETDCVGVKGVTVEITDASGQIREFTTNAAGNFMLQNPETPFVMPFTAKVIHDGKERAMKSPQSNGACATCHTAEGANGAPGRIVVPM